MQRAPKPPHSFGLRKAQILAELSVPSEEYTDASPKGSVDEGVRDLIDEINALDGLVTTSSCAGRLSVFLEGRKEHNDSRTEQPAEFREETEPETVGVRIKPEKLASSGGKGGGGTWLFVSHEPIVDRETLTKLFACFPESTEAVNEPTRRFIRLKFEPMILHVLTASPEHAQLLLRCGLQAGFRESGAINLTGSSHEVVTPMVAIRSNGLAFDSVIGVQQNGQRTTLLNRDAHTYLVAMANERFEENSKRIARFREALRDTVKGRPLNGKGEVWEHTEARRARKKAEGLRLKAKLEADGGREKAQDSELDLTGLDAIGLEN